MNEQIIKFIDEDVDGSGTDVTVLAKVYGNDITTGTIHRVKNAICNYKNENEGEWDTDGCLNAAQKQLKAEGYGVQWIDPSVEICF